MRIGVSQTISMSLLKTLKAAKPRIDAELYLHLIEYTLHVMRKFRLECVELVSFRPFNENLSAKDKIKAMIKGIECTYHLPFFEYNLSAFNKGIRDISIREMKKEIDFCSYLGIRRAVLHAGYFTEMHSIFLETTKRIADESLKKVVAHAQKRGVEICVENLPNNDMLFHSPDDMEIAQRNNAYVCLDTGHAITNGLDPTEFFERLSTRVRNIHLVDDFRNDRDRHLAIGKGDLRYSQFMGKLREKGYAYNIVLELMSEESLAESLKNMGFEDR